MSLARGLAAPCMALAAASAQAAETGADVPTPGKPQWEFGVTAYPTHVRQGDNTTSAIAVADRGALHLEGRYGYEAKDARAAFAGWTFAGGDSVRWEVTPLIGGAWGSLHAFIPGLETSVAWKRLDLYVEAEFVRGRRATADDYNYAWSELGFRALENLRIGAAGQRTRLYGGERQFQRGPFAQVRWKAATLGAYWFNPGSSDEIFVVSLGISF